MPKLKTNKAASKRFRQTKTGRFKRSMAYGRHLKSSKSAKRIRNLRKAEVVSQEDAARVRRMLPYGG